MAKMSPSCGLQVKSLRRRPSEVLRRESLVCSPSGRVQMRTRWHHRQDPTTSDVVGAPPPPPPPYYYYRRRPEYRVLWSPSLVALCVLYSTLYYVFKTLKIILLFYRCDRVDESLYKPKIRRHKWSDNCISTTVL